MQAAIKIYPADWAALCVEVAGKPYRPSNGSEGEHFIDSWCANCERDHGMMAGLPLKDCDDNRICGIIADTYCYAVDDPAYPKEWQYGKDGQPRCTTYVEKGQPIPITDELTGDLFAAMPPTTGEQNP